VTIDERAIMKRILAKCALDPMGDHGVMHWARVLENGLILAESTGADPDVLALFAMFHDSRRENEFEDPQHGWRGAEFAKQLRGELFELDDARFELLYDACRWHTNSIGLTDVTIHTCWDADRLDLPRLGIPVDPEKLKTAAARKLIREASKRACANHAPAAILRRWGVPHEQG
jgi:uncharacterized protein